MKTTDAFVINGRTVGSRSIYTLRYKGDDGQAREVTYSPVTAEEDTRLHNAIANPTIVRIVIDDDEAVTLLED